MRQGGLTAEKECIANCVNGVHVFSRTTVWVRLIVFDRPGNRGKSAAFLAD